MDYSKIFLIRNLKYKKIHLAKKYIKQLILYGKIQLFKN